jgi:two-component system NtrC family response regulator
VAEGAYDFYQKPIDADTLRFAVERAFRLADLEQENRHLVAAQEPASLGASSPAAKACRISVGW